MEKIDIAVIKTGEFFDIDFEDGDLKSVDSFDTAINMSIFEERRADESEQPVNDLRRGWVGNELSDVDGFEIGSKLWQLYQARATEDTSNKSVTILQEALIWLVEDGHLSNVNVLSELSSDNIDITITLVRSNNVVDSRSFKLWENTGKNQ
jgi:phage gp46-like protein